MDIKHNLTIKASSQTVYDAVATNNGIKGWWSKDCLVGEKEGEISFLKFDKQGKIIEMTFRTEILIPNKKVVWECIENANPAWLGTKIITEINEANGVSSVVFSHAGFDNKWAYKDAFEMTRQGWDHFVDSLVSYCENGDGEPW